MTVYPCQEYSSPCFVSLFSWSDKLTLKERKLKDMKNMQIFVFFNFV